jgi:hypothetical protein
MQQVACPGCGAPVPFKSAASVLAVCEYCKTTLLKDLGSVRDLGKMSDVLEDYSPLQIGTAGQVAAGSFSLVGRIQYRYTDGYWNEWYALFDDGRTGWLSDASGQYALTFAEKLPAEPPPFERLAPGRPLNLLGIAFTASDVRRARCTAGQGELPFQVGQGYEARVADFRAGDRFLSLDYSDAAPRLYVGSALRLADFKPQLLRDPAQISDSAGRFRGKVAALSCPSCGAPVSCVTGVTVQLLCPSCHAEVDTAGDTATVLAAGAAVEAVRFTLELGAEAAIEGTRYSLLGAMRRADDDGASWSEYLLYASGRPFIWLIETDEEWRRAAVLDRWPHPDGGGSVQFDNRQFNHTSDYQARVTFAAGAFNWRVRIGDAVRVSEYAAAGASLAAEISAEELTWSLSTPLAVDQVRAWFGTRVHAEQQPHPRYVETARKVVIALLVINAIPLLFATNPSWLYTALAAGAVYLPAYFLDRLDAGDA